MPGRGLSTHQLEQQRVLAQRAEQAGHGDGQHGAGEQEQHQGQVEQQVLGGADRARLLHPGEHAQAEQGQAEQEEGAVEREAEPLEPGADLLPRRRRPGRHGSRVAEPAILYAHHEPAG